MKIGFVGIGNLGFPLAVTMAWAGHEVRAYDIDVTKIKRTTHPVREAGYRGVTFEQMMETPNLSYGSLEWVCTSEIIFICVPTPHKPEFEGRTVLPPPEMRADFDYTFLDKALKNVLECCFINEAADDENVRQDVVIISTVLPGTTRRLLADKVIPEHVSVLYSPSFCAMGETVKDFLEPEMYLVGTADNDTPSFQAYSRLLGFYRTLSKFARILWDRDFDGPMPQLPEVHQMWYESAELSKVAYNTFISAKLGIVNMLAEMCDKISGANMDAVSKSLSSATKRIASGAYLQAGMGDGGACHPRDNIAMSWLAARLGIGTNLFEAIMMARESHALYLAEGLARIVRDLCLPHYPNICILGVAYKPGTNLIAGSHALLVVDMLNVEVLQNDHNIEVMQFDPYVYQHKHEDWHQYCLDNKIGAVLVGCMHDEFRSYKFPEHVHVVDPHRVYSYGQQASHGHLWTFGLGPTTTKS